MNRVKTIIKTLLFAVILNSSSAMASVWPHWGSRVLIPAMYECVDHHGKHQKVVGEEKRKKLENNFRKCMVIRRKSEESPIRILKL